MEFLTLHSLVASLCSPGLVYSLGIYIPEACQLEIIKLSVLSSKASFILFAVVPNLHLGSALI